MIRVPRISADRVRGVISGAFAPAFGEEDRGAL